MVGLLAVVLWLRQLFRFVHMLMRMHLWGMFLLQVQFQLIFSSHTLTSFPGIVVVVAPTPAVVQAQQAELQNKVVKFCEEAKNAFKYFCRIVQYFLYGAPLVVGVPLAAAGISPALEEAVWNYLIWAIEQLGPTFIKLAQWASSRPDLYPPALITRLQKLQDDVTSNQSLETVENTMSVAFGKDWKNHLELDPNPIGAGCIAQVYRGKLTVADSGADGTVVEEKPGKFSKRAGLKVVKSEPVSKSQSIPVAIKLIHPHVEDLIKTDMAMLNIFADFMDRSKALELLSLGDTCRQFADMMLDQLDLRKEAYNLKKFGRKFAKENWVVFPKPLDGFVCKNVLVETFMEGTPIKSFMRRAEEGAVGDKLRKLQLKLSDLACRAMLKMIFFDNFVHGDLHPGNVMVQFTPSGEPRFVFLDCGLIFQAKSEEEHQTLIDICLAFMRHDGMKAGKLMVQKKEREEELRAKLSRASNAYTHDLVRDADAALEEKRNANTDAFCKGLQQMIHDTETVKFFDHFGAYVNQICDLARDFQVKLDPDYFHVAMVMKVAEGMALSLNKEMDMITTCIPIVVKAQAFHKLGIAKFPLPGDE
jgi:aarF domain-containing kinase